MFLRIVKSKNKEYLVIVESYWDGSRSRQRNIGSLGNIEKLRESGKLEKLASALLKYCKQRKYLDITTTEEKDRKWWGAVRVYRKIWDEFKMDKLWEKVLEGRKIEFDLWSAVFLMVLDRLIDPKSKLKSFQEQDRYYGVKENSLQHLYRGLDILAESKEKIERYLFAQNINLFNMKVDVVFYDVTTLYFESVREDALKKMGFSKDGKFKEVQIMLGLLQDTEGRPVGYDVFPGSSFEGHTLPKALEKMKDKFQINRVIVIGDQALLSKKNIKMIKGKGYQYIVGGRIKNLPKEIKEEILRKDGYKPVKDKEGNEIFRWKRIQLGGEDLICSWSERKARRDRKEREQLVEKAKKMIEEGKVMGKVKRGPLRFIEIVSDSAPALSSAKIEEDERWDGYFGIRTDCKNLRAEKVLELYHQLWRIEESFRIFKTHLETRPMFHWTPKRIEGHLVLCFIAFLLERTLEIELRRNKIEYSPEKIRKALDSLQFSEIEIEGRKFFLRSPVEGLANQILRTMKIKIPPNIGILENF